MNDLQTITRELEEARQDDALFQRLRGAAVRVEELSVAHGHALAEQARVEAAAASAAHAARFVGLSDLQITRGGATDENLVRASFAISYTVTRDHGDGWPSSKRHTINGFRALDPLLFAFLIEEHPERIPAEIKALAPSDPHAAFDEYFTALRRGYCSAPKAAA